MSVFANHPRVTETSDGRYIIDGQPGEVPTTWVEPDGEAPVFLVFSDAETGDVFDTADEAIRSLIGDPR